MNTNQISIPGIGDSLTEADIVAFHAAGLSLPVFQHGPRDCTADWYAIGDRNDSSLMLRIAQTSHALGYQKHAMLASVGLDDSDYDFVRGRV